MSKANLVQHLTRAVVWEQYYSYKKHACPDHRNKSSASVSEGVRAISMSCRRSPSRGAPPVPGARQGNACLLQRIVWGWFDFRLPLLSTTVCLTMNVLQ